MPVISIADAIDALKEIRLYSNLRMLRDAQSKEFCEKYKITPQQFNFLISVVAVERINKSKVNAKTITQ